MKMTEIEIPQDILIRPQYKTRLIKNKESKRQKMNSALNFFFF